MSNGAWIGRLPSGPVVSFPNAKTEDEARRTCHALYGDRWPGTIEWSDDPEGEVQLCDFCSSPHPTIVVDIGTEIVVRKESPRGPVLHQMDSTWYFCSGCYPLFVDDLDGLTDRSVAAFIRINNVGAARAAAFTAAVRPEVSELHRVVRRAWDGTSVPLVPKGGE